MTAARSTRRCAGPGRWSSRFKPQDVVTLLGEVAGVLEPGALVVSLCAGLPTSLFEGALPEGTPVVRVMPNTPMLLGAAMCAISPGAHATPAHLDETEDAAVHRRRGAAPGRGENRTPRPPCPAPGPRTSSSSPRR
nr:hypothetical protein [Pseudonocardia sp. ICBG601]